MATYDEEIVPMNTVMKVMDRETQEVSDVETTVDRDNCNRPETNIEGIILFEAIF